MLERNLSTAPRARRFTLLATAFAVAVFSVVACSEDTTAPNRMTDVSFADVEVDGVIYDPVEFLGTPLGSEVAVGRVIHEASKRTRPYTVSGIDM